MKGELVSIIVPVYNAELYLEQSIKSLIGQTYTNIEIIIVIDGATDNSAAIAESFDDSRIVICRQENKGPAAARNLGIEISHGEYIGFLDADDFWDLSKIERHLLHFSARPAVGVSFSCSSFVDSSGRQYGVFQVPRLSGITQSYQCYCNPIGNGSASIIRRSVFLDFTKYRNEHGLETRWFKENLCPAEDYLFWLEILSFTRWDIEGIPELLTSYRIHSDSLSANLKNRYRAHLRADRCVSKLSPELFAGVKRDRRANLLFYLARSALLQGNNRRAVGYVLKGLIQAPFTFRFAQLAILFLGISGQLLPKTSYGKLQSASFAIFGFYQKKILLRWKRLTF